MVPERLSGEGRVGLSSVSHETSSGMGVERQHEDDEQMMGVPEGLEGLLADLGVCPAVLSEEVPR